MSPVNEPLARKSYDVLTRVANSARAYLDGIQDRTVPPRPVAVARLDELCTSLPENGMDVQDIFNSLITVVEPATVANAGGRYFGFVNGGCLPAALAASWLVDTWDQNAALYEMSPPAAVLEELAIRWTCELLNLPLSTSGVLLTGATMANTVCLAAARHALLSPFGWNVEEQGLFSAPEIQVVVGDEVHVSVLKGLSLLGLGRTRVTRVPVDHRGRMRRDAVPPLDDRTILCLQAGNVNSGEFDPASEIIPRAHEAGAWVHVDGAFGLWVKTSPTYAALAQGFEYADSWATDAHKWPNVGYDCGIALVKDGRTLRAAMASNAAYLQPGTARESMMLGPDMSRRARGIELWAAFLSLGRKGIAELVSRTCNHAKRFAEGLRQAGYSVLNEVVINQVLVSFGSSEKTNAVIRAVQDDGTCWCGGTTWQGHTAMRISVSSWATTDEDIDRSLACICELANSIR